MNVSTIVMDEELARKKLVAYREQLRRRADEEYEAAAMAYEAMAQGRPLLNLVDVFQETGLGEDERPKLAMARADRKQVMVRVYKNHVEFNALKNPWRWGYEGSLVIKVPVQNPVEWRKDGYALVPMVPADVRPKGNLRDYFILWEVEQWARRPLIAEPDRDPYLLRHVSGDLYAVVAEWDLTELERMIMAGRRFDGMV